MSRPAAIDKRPGGISMYWATEKLWDAIKVVSQVIKMDVPKAWMCFLHFCDMIFHLTGILHPNTPPVLQGILLTFWVFFCWADLMCRVYSWVKKSNINATDRPPTRKSKNSDVISPKRPTWTSQKTQVSERLWIIQLILLQLELDRDMFTGSFEPSTRWFAVGGRFKECFCFFTPQIKEMIHFEEHNFLNWVVKNHQLADKPWSRIQFNDGPPILTQKWIYLPPQDAIVTTRIMKHV